MQSESSNEQSGYTRLKQQGDQLIIYSSIIDESNKSIQGSLSSIRNLLNKDRLTSVSLENAINYTEDLIMPMLSMLPKQEALMVDGSEFERVVRLLLSSAEDVTVSLDAVENLYRQLADYSQGSQYAWREAISPEQVALGLVVLREIMQHGGFRSVSLHTRTS